MKYMGSKSRIAKYIVPILQNAIYKNHITAYYEPFCGGCNVIDKIKCESKFASDYNPYLIALFEHLQNGGTLYETVPKELYDRARTCFNNQSNDFELWELGNIGFLASYNGRWFDGGYAKPGIEKGTGRYRDYYREASDNILAQISNLKDVHFECKSYTNLSPDASLIYCDPPYANTKSYLNAQKFDYERFWDTVRKWSKNNTVFVSEENAPDDFKCVWEQPVSRSIKASDKSVSVEKLFTVCDCILSQPIDLGW